MALLYRRSCGAEYPAPGHRAAGCGAAHAKPQSWRSLRAMRLLLAILILIGTAVAHAQSGGTLPTSPGYQPYPPAYPPNTPNGLAERPPDQGPATQEPGGDAQSLARETLAPQNAVRALFGEPPLRWSSDLADAAQDWADRLVATGQFGHRPDDPYGENLYEITGGSASPKQVVDAWADEARDYDVATNTCRGVCGHFTQIVWRSTREVGCGVVGNESREVWVCEYDPPGNVVGYRPF